MKVIDLLNKIANGEITELSKFKYDNEIFVEESNEEISAMKQYKSEKGHMVLDYLCGFNRLNDEVEIIEEDKKIEKIDMFDYFTGYDFDNTSIDLRKHLEVNFQILNNKINEIIDYLYKGE